MPVKVKMGFLLSTMLQGTLKDVRMGRMISKCCKLLTFPFQIFSVSHSKMNNGYQTFQSQRRPYTVAIEGNIGSGKTSLLKYFKNRDPSVEVLMEPVNRWRDIKGHNGLALMYKDPSRWSLTFQTYVQLTMLQAHMAPTSKSVKLMERSLFSAKYCFVENLHRSGKMPDIEHVVLTEWFDWIIKDERVKVDLIVYLRTDPEVVHERIKRRCRKEEEAIPIQYLRQLHDLHEDWLIDGKYPLPCSLLVLDGNGDQEEMIDIFDRQKDSILFAHS